ncbi:MAG: Fe-S cluster assembly protein SufD [Bacteroidales bacterium]|jgi:Fe-S cluster assembly protein SufD|nr:Fe-S cluster assembly protein SufD [Bacteroidales bacterium]
MDNKAPVTDRYADLYRMNIAKIEELSSPHINSFRKDAIERFMQLGVPGRKNEAYRYTNLDPFFRHDYAGYFLPGPDDFRNAEKFSCEVEDLNVHNLVLLNGFYPTNNGSLITLPSGVVTGSLNEAARVHGGIVEKHYGRYAAADNDGLLHLNTAMASDGIFIHVPRGRVLDKPIQIVNLVMSDEDIFVQHRNLIVVEENAEATVIICDHTLSPKKFLTNAVTEVFVGANARFSIVRVQNEHNNAAKMTHTFIHQERGSNTYSNNITLHGGLVRNSTWHHLGGEGAETVSAGLYLTDKSQHVDNFVNVDHAFPNCTSNQVFKGVLDDVATGAFNGRILVRQDSQGTRAYQSNNTILLTDVARMDTKPQLEIFADDVKCSHGATIGQLNEDALFYLRSRGIDSREARLMLMFGFAHEVIQGIPVEALRERMDMLVMQRLRGELSRCASCMVRCG